MRKHRLPVLLVLAVLLLACNFPLFAPRPTPTSPAPAQAATDTSSPPVVASFTPVPATPTATIVPTPSVPVVTPNSANVNCREGPDVAYNAIGVLSSGSSTQVTGRSDDSSWWYVRDPANQSSFCWIFSGVVTISGPTGSIPVVAAPFAIVTGVTAGAALPSTIACGGPNPITFSGTITTNGALTAKYQWEITGDQTNTTSPETLNFTDAGTKDVPNPGAYNVDCGKYTVTLHVLSPNDISAKKNFQVAAP